MAYQDHETAVARRMMAALGARKALQFARQHAKGDFFKVKPAARRHWNQVARRIEEQQAKIDRKFPWPQDH